MKLTIKNKSTDKVKSRAKKRLRIRKKVIGSQERPRFAVFRSLNNIYAQLVDDMTGVTLVAASSLEFKKEKSSGKEKAQKVGQLIAKRALEKQHKNVVFDRSGYIYHGKIKALADSAREAGLSF